ncbi:CoA-binding protein [Candidatus Bathyarchaeota archaeon]|nr:CoA-binding protein [Candidatus Bathyarchaeota archaeon]
MFNKDELDNFFNAKSVAVIGASETPGKIGYEVLRSLSQYGYKGRVYPVTPKSKEILGVKCYPSVQSLPETVDLAVFTLSSVLVPGLLQECGEKGVKNVVIVSGGFQELGGQYQEIQTKVVEIAKKYGIRIIGPNCIGVFNSKNRLDTFFQSHERMTRPPLGPIAFLTQSGTFGCTMLEWAAESGVGISKFVSYGNRCDVDEADLIRYLGADTDTKVIAIYLESIQNGRKFMAAVQEVLPHKPIVVLKAGKTDWGSRAARSHTGQLAGSYQVCEAAFKQSGLIEAKNFEELFDMAKALALQPPAAGNRIAMVTNGAGPCVMAADACVERGLVLAKYQSETIRKLKSVFPPYYVVENPVDLTGSATSQDYEVAIQHLAQDQKVDLIMPFFVFQDTPLDEKIVEVIPKMTQYGKPIVCCASGGQYTKAQAGILERRGIPVFPIPERAVAAAYALVRYGTIIRRC